MVTTCSALPFLSRVVFWMLVSSASSCASSSDSSGTPANAGAEGVGEGGAAGQTENQGDSGTQVDSGPIENPNGY